jgi:3-dehydroquinate dehydratase II
VYGRETFRHTSLISAVCAGKVVGFGWRSYTLGLQAVVDLIRDLNPN